MFSIHNFNNYLGQLDSYLDIIENDTSSIVYHTRVFDNMVIDSILDGLSSFNLESSTSLLFSFNFEFLFESTSCNVFYLLYKDIYLLFSENLVLLTSLFDSKIFSNDLTFFLFDSFLVLLTTDFFNSYICKFIIFFQKNEVFSFIGNCIGIFSDFIFQLDVFLIILELVIVLFIFSLLFGKVSNFFITTKFYDNILNFFKYNNISFLEFSITCTLFIFFYIFDIFLSFSEDDSSDTYFYLMLIFIVMMFFFLSIAIDIQYFYSMSNASTGDVTLRILFFDILNNLLSVLRIFLCWIRYIFYDLQVEAVDFSFHYIDYNNEVCINFLLKNSSDDKSTINNFDISFTVMLKSFFFYLLYFFFDITIIIIQIILSVFKLLIAFYLFWLIVDLFILKVLCLKESNRFFLK